MSAESEREIEYKVSGKVAVITINRPSALNALNYYHYAAIEECMLRAAEEPSTIVTLIQSTGDYFSSGADVQSRVIPKDRTTPIGTVDFNERRALQGPFAGRNTSITHTFWTHPKVVVVALNGPVVGLSASLVALADFIYARDSAFLLVPFANLSLVTEGAAAFTLPSRLGLSLANEALLSCRPIHAPDLLRVGFVNKLWPAKQTSTPEFNEIILKKLQFEFDALDPVSVKFIKTLIHGSFDQHLHSTSAQEAIMGLDRFASGLPQVRFAALAKKQHRHKL